MQPVRQMSLLKVISTQLEMLLCMQQRATTHV